MYPVELLGETFSLRSEKLRTAATDDVIDSK